jgi:hypothetical protein
VKPFLVVLALLMTPKARPASEPAAPFELSLEVEGNRLLARLRNRSSGPQVYLVDPHLQPVELALTTGGRPSVPQDSRQIMKFDRTLHRDLYRELAPGAEVVLLQGAFRPVKGERDRYELVWGPFHFAVAGGTHRVRALLEHRLDRWEDDGKNGRMRVWKGRLVSPEVELKLGRGP